MTLQKILIGLGIVIFICFSALSVFFFLHVSRNSTSPQSLKQNTPKTLNETNSNNPNIQTNSTADIIKRIYQKYGYASGPIILFSDAKRVWFDVPHETEGCGNYMFIDRTTGEESESSLVACPQIKISDSLPFYIAYCVYHSCYDGQTLYATNLLTLEQKAVHTLTKNDETIIQSCEQGDFGLICKAGISFKDNILQINTYKNSHNSDVLEAYENTHLLRTEKIDLSRVFETK